MKLYSYYHKDTGLFDGQQVMVTDIRGIEGHIPADHMAIEGHHDPLTKKVDLTTGNVVDYQPPQPSDDHEWHEPSKSWVIKQSILDEQARRNAIMVQINALEAKQPRVIRDIFLNSADGSAAMKQLHDIEDQIVELRKGLK